ncbi:MAG: histidinol-phosphate transaminase [Rhodobacteraceae bacterium]|nr:histidinol-phosphate transaminase [Paracoccaceae bacterium]
MTGISPRPGILDIIPYVGGKAHVEGVSNTVKLSSNENPWGASEQARQAFRALSGNLHIYPASDHGTLRTAIAETCGLDGNRIICSNGSDELIAFLCHAYAGAGDDVLCTEHGFSMYGICARACGATPVHARETDRHTDVDALLAAITPATRLIFVANPNNPTGTLIEAAELGRLAAGLPPECLLVIDGAYAEFLDTYDDHIALIENHDNVFMIRTFSKIYGLGALRVGWGYGSAAVIDVLNRIRGPFNVNAAAQAAAEAALRDTRFVEKCRTRNAELRRFLTDGLRRLGLACDTSYGNFVLARFADEAEADGANEALGLAGLIVRQVKGYGFPEGLRITVGKGADCGRVLAVLREFLGK